MAAGVIMGEKQGATYGRSVSMSSRRKSRSSSLETGMSSVETGSRGSLRPRTCVQGERRELHLARRAGRPGPPDEPRGLNGTDGTGLRLRRCLSRGIGRPAVSGSSSSGCPGGQGRCCCPGDRGGQSGQTWGPEMQESSQAPCLGRWVRVWPSKASKERGWSGRRSAGGGCSSTKRSEGHPRGRVVWAVAYLMEPPG